MSTRREFLGTSLTTLAGASLFGAFGSALWKEQSQLRDRPPTAGIRIFHAIRADISSDTTGTARVGDIYSFVWSENTVKLALQAGCIPCEGQILKRESYTALYDVLDRAGYGGKVPDLWGSIA